jgi:methylated-DNA-[protein]-cysteine S-methyltransferase
MNTIHIQSFHTDFGELILGGFESRLCLCDWHYRKSREAVDARLRKFLQADFSEEADQVTTLARLQLEEYFDGRRKAFDLPLLLVGTDFQKRVWEELLKIPYGKTLTYTQLSGRLNNPLGIRAIAAANGANALSIIVPCHRIIGAKGEMVGYAGGTRAKEKLLQLEQSSGMHQFELFG